MQERKRIHLSKIEDLVNQESSYIKGLFSKMCLSTKRDDLGENFSPKTQRKQLFNRPNNSRAESLTELQQRLELVKGKHSLSYKEKQAKKSMKSKLRKKNKIHERITQKTIVNVGKIETERSSQELPEKLAKPIFNSEGKMVFSKFDFSEIGKKDYKKNITDPKKLLDKLEKHNEKLSHLKEVGELDEAVKIEEKTAWKNALAKAGGEKVRDNPILLKKTIKKKEQQHKASKKKWESRQMSVIKNKEEKQKKRQDNIQKRKKSKKIKKLKTAAKKGKIIPGF